MIEVIFALAMGFVIVVPILFVVGAAVITINRLIDKHGPSPVYGTIIALTVFVAACYFVGRAVLHG